MPRGRSGARRRHVPRERRGRAQYFGYGPQAPDALTGVYFPKSEMVEQRGGLVYRKWSYGSRDVVDPIDRKYPGGAQPVFPDPLWRVFDGAAYWLTADADERDDALTGAGDRFNLVGYAYPVGDEESGLVRLRRLFKSSITTYLFTTSDAEATAALSDGYAEQTPSVAIYVFATSALNRRPVYRALHASGRYFYSTDLADFPGLGATWAFQGAQFYVLRGEERTIS